MNHFGHLSRKAAVQPKPRSDSALSLEVMSGEINLAEACTRLSRLLEVWNQPVVHATERSNCPIDLDGSGTFDIQRQTQ